MEKEGRQLNINLVTVNMNTMSFVSRINFCSFKAEQPSALKSEEENHEQSTEQDKAYSLEEDLKDEEDAEGDLSVNLDYSPTEGAIDAQDGTSEPPQQEKLPESTDFPEVASTSSVDSNRQANVTKGEGSQEQSEGDANQQLNKNNQHNQDLMDEESPEQDPGAPDEEEEEEEEEPGDVGAPGDNQEREKEPPEEQPISKQEGNSDQSDDPLEESSQPTQLSKREKNGFEQGNEEQEGNSNAEGEDKTASSAKHIQRTEWQGQEGKAVLEATGSQKDEDEKTVSAEPTDGVAILASYDGSKDDAKHGTSDDYFIPSQELLEAGKADPLSYYLKRAEQATDENEKVDKSEAEDNQRVRLFTMMLIQSVGQETAATALYALTPCCVCFTQDIPKIQARLSIPPVKRWTKNTAVLFSPCDMCIYIMRYLENRIHV